MSKTIALTPSDNWELVSVAHTSNHLEPAVEPVIAWRLMEDGDVLPVSPSWRPLTATDMYYFAIRYRGEQRVYCPGRHTSYPSADAWVAQHLGREAA